MTIVNINKIQSIFIKLEKNNYTEAVIEIKILIEQYPLNPLYWN